MSIVLMGSTSGSVTLAEPAIAGSSTINLPVGTGTAVVNGVNGALVSGTAVASTSGTSIDFTSIPSWVKRITVMFQGVSTSATSIVQVQLGSGSPATSGYLGGYIQASSGAAVTLAGLTTGFIVGTPTTANATFQGSLVITLLSSSTNTWTDTGNIADSTNQRFWSSSGSVSLSGVLDRVRITTVNGTDTFDAGSINILYE